MSTITRGTLFNGPMASYFAGKVSIFLSVGESYRTLPLVCKAFNRGAWQPTEIRVGNRSLARTIKTEVSRRDPATRLAVREDVVVKSECEELHFGRDSKVVLLDGTWLLPYPIQERDEILRQHVGSLSSIASAHFIAGDEGLYGSGFSAEYHERALGYAKQRNLPFVLSRCCVEGGNCIITKNVLGEPVAFVGEHSWILSLIALEEQGYFKDKAISSDGAAHLGPGAIRIARNFALFQQWLPVELLAFEILNLEDAKQEVPPEKREEFLRKKKALGGHKGYCRSLLRGMTDKELSQYRCSALEIQQKLALTFKLMAHELRVSPANLVMLPQMRFHIDMDMTAFGPKLLVHDPKQALRVLQGFDPSKRPNNFSKYAETAAKEAEMFARHLELSQRAIEKVACRCLRAGLVFEAAEEISLNFINVLHVKTGGHWLLFTSDASKEFEPLRRHFETTVKESVCSRIQVIFVKGMKEIITKHSGGTHCLTWEG